MGLAAFCRIAPQGGGSGAVALVGAPAAKLLVDELLAKADRKDAVSFGDTVNAWTFSWLLAADDDVKLKKLRHTVVAQSGVSAPSAAASSSSKGGSKKKVLDARDTVRALFKS